ncbi:hypothetical protein ACHAXT_003029 [Thalassiosira profunda]
MEIAYEYVKKRSQFGKQTSFQDGETTLLESILPTDAYDDQIILRKSQITGTDTTPELSEAAVNTVTVKTTSTGVHHTEGGWPKDVDPTEQSDTKRYRKKVEKDEEYQYAMKTLIPRVQRCMKQNNSVNVYEDYFQGIDSNAHCSEPPFAKGLAVFRDPSPVTRTATSVNWHPEGSNNGKLAVSYAVLNFQDKRHAASNMPTSSYVWDVSNSNKPIAELVPSSPLCCLRYNPKSSDTLVGGSYNGTISFFDTRKSSGKCQPAACSVVESSHHDPVSDVHFVSSKTGSTVVSVSTDGQMLWWDTRKLAEGPIDSVVLATDAKGGGTTLGGSSLEYNTEAGPTKFLCGSEQGIVLSLNTRNRKTNNGITVFDTDGGQKAPVPSIQRNPIHTKFFLTVSAWTAKLWSEDIKTPIFATRPHSSYLTGGCWSPTRAGVFYVTRSDGVVDVWDISQNMNDVTYSHKVTDAALSCIGVSGNGKLVACGDNNGTITLLEVSNSLSQPQPNEKATVGAVLEREAKKEKQSEKALREQKRAKAIAEERRKKEEAEGDGKNGGGKADAEMDALESAFFQMTQDNE